MNSTNQETELKTLPGPWSLGEMTGNWRDIDLPDHGGVMRIVWKMEDDEGRNDALEAQAHAVVAALNAAFSKPPAEQQAASSAVLKAIREANMQLVHTGDDAFMLVPYKLATAEQAAPKAAPAEVIKWPKDASEVREFMHTHCITEQYAVGIENPSDDDKYLLSAHDFLSAVNWWADFPHYQAASPTPPAEQQAGATTSETVPFVDKSTADPVEKARRYLTAMGDNRLHSTYFFDDGFPKQESASDALATLAILEQLAAPQQEAQEPFGYVTTHSKTGQQVFYRYPDPPYLDNASECVTVYTAPQTTPAPLSRDQIREVFMAHGFTIKEGQTDLKQYVYDAAHALLELVAAPQPAPAPLSDDSEDAARWRMLPAFFAEYQIDAMKLYRDVDAALAAQGDTP